MAKYLHFFSFFQAAKKSFHGELDYLILNHVKQNKASNWIGSQSNMTSLKEMYDINFFAYVQLASLFMPNLQYKNGRITVISSFVGKIYYLFIIYFSYSIINQGTKKPSYQIVLPMINKIMKELFNLCMKH